MTVRAAPLVRWGSPAARLLAAVSVTVAVATLPPRPLALAAAAVVALGLLGAARPRWTWLWRRAALALLGLSAVGLPLLVSSQGFPWLLVRAALALVVALALAAALKPEELSPALRALGLPRAIGDVVAAMLWQLTRLSDEARRLLLARRLRGARGSQLGVGVIATLLVRTALRADRIALAAELRGVASPSATVRRGLRRADAPLLALSLLAGASLHVLGALA